MWASLKVGMGSWGRTRRTFNYTTCHTGPGTRVLNEGARLAEDSRWRPIIPVPATPDCVSAGDCYKTSSIQTVRVSLSGETSSHGVPVRDL